MPGDPSRLKPGDPLPTSDVVDQLLRERAENLKDQPEDKPKPIQLGVQITLFKTGVMGDAVTIWSSVQPDGYGPTQAMLEDDKPVVVRRDAGAEEIDKTISFVAGYIYGWVEKIGGERAIDQLDIWLEPAELQGETDETPAQE
ncbi:hypothetical protein SEA_SCOOBYDOOBYDOO_58 [Mycobacterium phage ScoobyDoobyDoo]|nr:hypothetical protein SEA_SCOOBYDOOBYDOO_58 [Mycobacterium phage ScoobyDoobyDoo]